MSLSSADWFYDSNSSPSKQAAFGLKMLCCPLTSAKMCGSVLVENRLFGSVECSTEYFDSTGMVIPVQTRL
ncbi:MAG: hypothetical protein P1U77_28195 [Rubripirellula sp.]|nr:hypothetical protein [Rubripirellula sp.]